MDFGKHQFLKREPSCHLHANVLDRIISRSLKQEIRNEITNRPFLPLINFESEIFCPEVDVTRSHLAFGRRAIPKLKSELLSKDMLTAKRALNSLLDLVHDPERAVEAIRLQVIPRLVRLMMSDDPFVRQHVLMVLEVLSLQPGGKMAIINHRTIMSNLSVLMGDENRNVRLSSAKTLQALTTWYFGVEELVMDYYVYLIINQLNHELDSEIMAVLMQTLISLLDQSTEAKGQALEHNAIELSVFLDHPETRLRALGTAIVSQLVRHPMGKLAIFDHRRDILAKLTQLLDDKDTGVQTHAAGAIMFALVMKEIRIHCLRKLPTMCALIRCAQFYRSSDLQVNAMKGLTCMAEHPQGREFLKQNLDQINRIRVADSQAQRHKDILITPERFFKAESRPDGTDIHSESRERRK